MSGVGKGIATSSIALLLKSRGFRVSAIKIDPYINVDAGTMNPTEHGEVFVTDDGMETDQDIGNYERFLEQKILSLNYMTTGSVYARLIEQERNLEFNGKCVSVVPHVPLEVIKRIKKAGESAKAEIMLVEIGGTVGEYENLLFLEAARILKLEEQNNVKIALVSYLPIPRKIGEMKTKPTQHACRALNQAGLQADFIIARAEVPLDETRKQKISFLCNVRPENIISAPDIESIYEVPLNFEKENLSELILKSFKVKPRTSDLKEWKELVKIIKTTKKEVRIGIVGKYFKTGDFMLADSYISVIEAIKHSCWHFKMKPKILWLNSEDYEKDAKKVSELKQYDGIIIPGGFGNRGVEGKIKAIEFVRKNKIPYLGLCYGMQLAVIEFARNVAGFKNAHTTEVMSNTPNPVIDIISEQKENMAKKNYGATMRLGAYECALLKNTIAFRAYKENKISERHRHRFEFNNDYKKRFQKAGMVFSGINPQKNLVEIIELHDHPFFVGTQFHPEFKSRPLFPHPLFREFIKVSVKNKSNFKSQISK